MLLPLTAWAPGRVNLIGEHTDYSGGLAMPAAIQFGVTVTVESVAEEIIASLAALRGGRRVPRPTAPGRRSEGWARYGQAVAYELNELGRRPVGIVATIDVRPACGRRPLVVGGARGRDCARALRGRGAQPRAARAGAGLPARRGASGRRPVRDPRPGGVRARPGGHGDRARLRDDSSIGGSRCRPTRPSSSSTRGSPVRSRRPGMRTRRDELERALAVLGVARSTEVDVAAVESLDEPLRRRLRHVVTENARVTAFADAVGSR